MLLHLLNVCRSDEAEVELELLLTSHQTHYRYRYHYRSNDPTNSVKALKENRVLSIMLQISTPLGPPLHRVLQ